ncbi:EamA family transporter RarD [Undibacterium baiyunense]|uniref:EamA family transporter RarD n=1 Tax=Undibacterium baiyunense TaxID=2828731 RepID=A0A941DDJ8_9BURK|nr:EamA family transporter RarD [Undibacterium baiyunense]MBR7744992.1 EamA family transporter RarD [Undibacterium baiyunense]
MRKGILYAAACYSAWGLFPIYFKALHSIPSLEILLHRMVWALVFLLLVLTVRHQWTWIRNVVRQPKLLAGFAASALLLSANWFLYIWAINNDRIVDASLGYFMTPLVNVFLGFILLKERLRGVQWFAIACAGLGVLWLGLQTGHPPWIALVLATTFGMYGLLRKTAALGALEGLSLETMLLFPFALAHLIYLALHGQSAFLQTTIATQFLLLAAGPITAIPLLMFAAAARRIPLATLGLMQYISPTIQLFIGIWLYNEQFSHDRMLGFLGIWAGLLVYSIDSLRSSFMNKTKTA